MVCNLAHQQFAEHTSEEEFQSIKSFRKKGITSCLDFTFTALWNFYNKHAFVLQG